VWLLNVSCKVESKDRIIEYIVINISASSKQPEAKISVEAEVKRSGSFYGAKTFQILHRKANFLKILAGRNLMPSLRKRNDHIHQSRFLQQPPCNLLQSSNYTLTERNVSRSKTSCLI